MSDFEYLRELQVRIGVWADCTFGDGQRLPAIIRHLRKEVDVLAERPYDIEVFADCMILFLDAARKAGISTDQLIIASFEKLGVNKKRTAGMPDVNGGIEQAKLIDGGGEGKA